MVKHVENNKALQLLVGNSADIIAKAQAIRKQVFVLEQHIPLALDLDGLDELSHHALVELAGSLVGTARLTVGEKGHAVMARIAVIEKYRGAGIAGQIIQSLIAYAQQLELATIEIHAHAYLKGYYQGFGFCFVREVEVAGEHQLIHMQLTL